MKTFNRALREGTYIKGVECFALTNDRKEPKHRVAFFDYKIHGSPTPNGSCKCGGSVVQLTRSPTDWSVCTKCGKDFSKSEKPRRLVGWSGYLP